MRLLNNQSTEVNHNRNKDQFAVRYHKESYINHFAVRGDNEISKNKSFSRHDFALQKDNKILNNRSFSEHSSKWQKNNNNSTSEEGEIDAILAEFFVSQCTRSDVPRENSSFKLSENEIMEDMMASQVARSGQGSTGRKRDSDRLPSIEEECEDDYTRYDDVKVAQDRRYNGGKAGHFPDMARFDKPLQIRNDCMKPVFNSQQEYQRFLHKNSYQEEIVIPRPTTPVAFGEEVNNRSSCRRARVEEGLIQHYLLPEVSC